MNVKKAVSSPAVAWAAAIILGVLNVIPVIFWMNPDGISYLNLASLYQAGDWSSAVNAYWSPMYPLLIAATLRLVPASPFFESTVVHALNFVIYLGAFAAFRFFLSEIRKREGDDHRDDADEVLTVSFGSVAELACAYSLFFWTTLCLIGLVYVTPDILISLLLFVAAGLTIRLKRNVSLRGYLGLGAVIGLAYLTKAVMFPLGVLMCLACALPSSLGAASKKSAIALTAFMLVASPQFIAMSRFAGRPSYGETGTIAYANEVNHVSKMWVGEPTGSGTPVHPMKQISSNPPAFEFATSNKTFSYPVSDQLAYWMQGVRVRWSLSEQLGVTKPILYWYVGAFDVLIFAAVAMFLLRSRMQARYVSLIIPALGAFALYSLVYSESRYLSPWVVILFLCFMASVRFGRNAARGVMAISGAIGFYYGASVLNYSREAIGRSIALARSQHQNGQFQTAVDLQKLGLKRGSDVAAIGYAFNGYWARLAGVQISMQVPDAEAYSSAPDSSKRRIIESFRNAGAVAVVSTGKPAIGAGEDWKPAGPLGYWVLMLTPAQQNLPKSF